MTLVTARRGSRQLVGVQVIRILQSTSPEGLEQQTRIRIPNSFKNGTSCHTSVMAIKVSNGSTYLGRVQVRNYRDGYLGGVGELSK